MRIALWIAAALALLFGGYCLDLAVQHSWAATAPLAPDPDLQGKWAGRFFGFAFLLLSSAVGLTVLAIRARSQPK